MTMRGRGLVMLIVIATLTGCSAAATAPTVGPSTAAAATTAASTMAPITPTPATPRPSPAAATPAPSGSLYDPNADAKAEITAALAAAKGDGKRVLLDFGADWCPDCHVLATYLEGPAGRKLVDRAFHVVSIDVGYWDKNLDVAEAAGNPIAKGIPAVVIVEADGSIVASTADGSLASARTMSEADVLAKLAAWAP